MFASTTCAIFCRSATTGGLTTNARRTAKLYDIQRHGLFTSRIVYGSSGIHKYDQNKKKKPKFHELAYSKKFIKSLSEDEKRILFELLQKDKDHTLVLEDEKTSAAPLGRPTTRQLLHLALHQSLPFVGFGFLDNLIMILAGEYIDHHIGVALGISTMAAAALGNAISDAFGIGSAFYVESLAERAGVTPPPLTQEQLDMGASKAASNFGKAGGVVVGCVIGMFPLLFN